VIFSATRGIMLGGKWKVLFFEKVLFFGGVLE
jgi:hypothetical protein